MSDNESHVLRVLYAEDGHLNQILVQEMLGQAGLEVDIAENGRKALAAIETKQYDLLLLDVQMPEIDGFEVARRIREQEAKTGGHLPIVALTAHAMKGDRQRCLEAGMDDYVSKPFDEETLLAAMARFIPGFPASTTSPNQTLVQHNSLPR